MGVRVLADKRHKLTILTTKPANEAAPKLAELNAGIEACLKVASEGFSHTPADSATVEFKALCGTREQVFTDSNFTLAMTVVRYYLVAGGTDPADDVLFNALKVRGTTLWAYGRLTDKLATAVWATGDEIYLGTRFTPDHAQVPDNPGWISFRIPCTVQDGWPFIAVSSTV